MDFNHPLYLVDVHLYGLTLDNYVKVRICGADLPPLISAPMDYYYAILHPSFISTSVHFSLQMAFSGKDANEAGRVPSLPGS